MAAAASRIGLSYTDLAHRVLVSGLFGLSAYGLFGIGQMHFHRIELGRLAQIKHEEEEAAMKLTGGSALLEGKVDPPPERPT